VLGVGPPYGWDYQGNGLEGNLWGAALKSHFDLTRSERGKRERNCIVKGREALGMGMGIGEWVGPKLNQNQTKPNRTQEPSQAKPLTYLSECL